MKRLDFEQRHEYLVCVDSDGCLLDNMELKHKECFTPATVNVWNLQPVSKYARQTAEFVNLYSRSRGWNRFPALVRTLDLLFDRPEVKEVGLEKPDLSALRRWIETTPTLSTPALRVYCAEHGIEDGVLRQTCAWGEEVDANIRRIVRNIRPFPNVRAALGRIAQQADLVVVSATPNEALTRELKACGIVQFFNCVAGQETGTKSESIRLAMQGRYAPDHVLKVGDAASDYKAAQDNGVLFYPIVPGMENESWKTLELTAFPTFVEGSYRGERMDGYLAAFLSYLPETAPW
ncbi:MAG: HAD family hydrolase [Clostridia bacterium]|nr:HAD family hydrolase [Clostridia bacterium]